MSTLDSFGVFTPTSEMQKPLILSDAHADYLYEQSHDRLIEKSYDYQIQEKLAEEREEEQQHKNYVTRNYVRIGGN